VAARGYAYASLQGDGGANSNEKRKKDCIFLVSDRRTSVKSFFIFAQTQNKILLNYFTMTNI
jgi:hypothetical protein